MTTNTTGNSRQLKVAIIGCGQIADGHVTEIDASSRARLVAVCDNLPSMARQLAMRSQEATAYSDSTQMLAECKPDVVHICTPPKPHLAIARSCIDAGAHLYVEKPIGFDAQETQDLAAMMDAAKLKWTAGHVYHFDPAMRKTRELVNAGAIGKVFHIDSWFGYNLAGPFGSVLMANPDHWINQLPGGLLQNNFNHLIGKMIEFLPDAPIELQTKGWNDSKEPSSIAYTDLRAMLRVGDVSAYASFSSQAQEASHTMRIYGVTGTLHVDFINRSVRVDKPASLPSSLGKVATNFGNAWRVLKHAGTTANWFRKHDMRVFSGMGELLERFYLAIQNDLPTPIPPAELIRTEQLMHQIFADLASSEDR